MTPLYANQFFRLGNRSSDFQVRRTLNTTMLANKLSLCCKRNVKVKEHGQFSV
jgi:hypothetical protein